MKTLSWLLKLTLLLLTGAGTFYLRCYNVRDIFLEGRIFFVDADCYSRMSRVQILASGGTHVIRHHTFENFPDGVHSHATAPLDYLLLSLKWIVEAAFSATSWGAGSVLVAQSADLAGALISPLLGAATAMFLLIWGWSVAGELAPGSPVLRWCCAVAPPLLFATSPILVQATLLGRPDHQSLLIFCLAVALALEASLASRKVVLAEVSPKDRRTTFLGVMAGTAWGLSLWVSLYEPPILLLAVCVLVYTVWRNAALRAARLWELGTVAFFVVLSFVVEGWRLEFPSTQVRQYFAAWGSTIGELHSVPLFGPVLPEWLGWSCVAAPVLLVLSGLKVSRVAWGWLLLCVATVALACWQLRWGYFAALVFALSLPWQLERVRKGWLAALLIFLSCFGPAAFWERQLYPDDEAQQAAVSRRRVQVEMYKAATFLKGLGSGAFVAPSWESPAIAYWSGHPGISGSSHQSLPGSVDAARFFLATPLEDQSVEAILRKRQVRYVVADEPDFMLWPQAALLSIDAPPNSLAARLSKNPHDATPFLMPLYTNLFFKVFAVNQTSSTE